MGYLRLTNLTNQQRYSWYVWICLNGYHVWIVQRPHIFDLPSNPRNPPIVDGQIPFPKVPLNPIKSDPIPLNPIKSHPIPLHSHQIPSKTHQIPTLPSSPPKTHQIPLNPTWIPNHFCWFPASQAVVAPALHRKLATAMRCSGNLVARRYNVQPPGNTDVGKSTPNLCQVWKNGIISSEIPHVFSGCDWLFRDFLGSEWSGAVFPCETGESPYEFMEIYARSSQGKPCLNLVDLGVFHDPQTWFLDLIRVFHLIA